MSSLHRNNNSSMFTAIKKKDVARVLQMISLPGYDINYVTKKKITPLILAAKFGLCSVCEKLVRLRVDIKCSDIDGRTALHHASYQGHLDVVRLLIEAGASIHRINYEGDQPLHEAICGRHLDVVNELILAGSDVNEPNHVMGITPLEFAVLHESSEIVETLLAKGAQVHHRSKAKETVLHYAVQVKSTKIIQQLLDSGASVNARNHHGETPLAIAIQEKKLSVIKYLVGCRCDFGYSEYLSPLYIACRQNSQDIICYLLSEGYNVGKDSSFRRYIFLQLEESNPALLSYLQYRCENPLSLKEICRIFVRRGLQPSIREKLQGQNLPKSLLDWVTMDDIYGQMFLNLKQRKS